MLFNVGNMILSIPLVYKKSCLSHENIYLILIVPEVPKKEEN